jgi:hypothetical protein
VTRISQSESQSQSEGIRAEKWKKEGIRRKEGIRKEEGIKREEGNR